MVQYCSCLSAGHITKTWVQQPGQPGVSGDIDATGVVRPERHEAGIRIRRKTPFWCLADTLHSVMEGFSHDRNTESAAP